MTDIQRKSIPAHIKAGDGGELYALASTYDRDLTNERVIPGAFAKSLAQWRGSGDSLPLLWNHQIDTPLHFLGVVEDARETDRGLEIRASLDTDNELARATHKLLRRRSVKSLSIGYTIPAGTTQTGRDGALELHEIDLREISVVMTPANPHAVIEAVKNAEAAQRNGHATTRDQLATQLAELGVGTKRTRSDELHVATFEVAR